MAPMGYPGQTPGAAPGLPATCPTCRTDNPPGMRFCRNCGTVLGGAQGPGTPPPYGPPPGVVAGSIGGSPGSAPVPLGYPIGPPPMGPPMGPPPMGHGMPPMGGPLGPPPPMGPPVGTGPGMGQVGGYGAIGSPPPGMPAVCPRCNAPTQAGFAFCQQCGFRLTAGAPPAPGNHVDAQGATLAAPNLAAAQLRPAAAPVASASTPPSGPATAPSPSWGVAVSVNRDGTDGERFPLAAEYVVVGRAGADIAFDQDRFLARQHARLELAPDGTCRVVPIDTLNGVFRKLDAPIDLPAGSILLIGREVLRFELVEADERVGEPLVRHGVALFGSPPRAPWGRLLQLLPSGGVRDVRHLWDDEITVGREEGDLVYSDDAFLSRRHCTIGWDGSRAVITDLGSSNGTFIRLAGPAPVRSGEHVRMGDQLFRIELRR